MKKYIQWRFKVTKELVSEGQPVYSTVLHKWITCGGKMELLSWDDDNNVVVWRSSDGEIFAAHRDDNQGAPPMGWADDSFIAECVI